MTPPTLTAALTPDSQISAAAQTPDFQISAAAHHHPSAALNASADRAFETDDSRSPSPNTSIAAAPPDEDGLMHSLLILPPRTNTANDANIDTLCAVLAQIIRRILAEGGASGHQPPAAP